MAKRVYLVKDRTTNIPRLIRASNRTHARGFAAIDKFGVSIADQDDLIELIGGGMKVEDAAKVADDDDESASPGILGLL